MPPKTLEITTKIILIYSLFYTGLKLIAVFRGAWLEANLILASPFVFLAVWGGIILRKKRFSWFYAVAGILIVALTRFYEKDWAVELNSFFST